MTIPVNRLRLTVVLGIVIALFLAFGMASITLSRGVDQESLTSTICQLERATLYPRVLSTLPPNHSISLATGDSETIAPARSVRLDASNDSYTFGLDLVAPGVVRLDLIMSAPGTDWARQDAESAVLSLYIDGKYQQDVVLWGGGELTSYPLLAGEMAASGHSLTLRYAPEKSRAGAGSIEIASGLATLEGYETKSDQWADRYAPALIGRSGLTNNHDDTPLALYATISDDEDGKTKISYGYVFSNEDGGDASEPAVEQARWGRLTDIQHVFTTTIDSKGHLLSEEFEGPNHVIRPFKGHHDGSHPIIVTATSNNNVVDFGDGPLCFRMPADYRLLSDEPSGQLMIKEPRWFEIMADELNRENKIDPDCDGNYPRSSPAHDPWHHKMADPRRYLYVQYKSENAKDGPIAAKLTMLDGKSFVSDFGVDDVALDADGWNQTAVLIPKDASAKDIQELSFISRKKGTGKVTALGRVFMLDGKYVPYDVTVPHHL